MNHSEYMAMAIKEARKAGEMGEIPVGAVIVHKGEVIASAHNLKETLNDPTAHAEILAMKEACQKLNNWRLTECTLYVTLEPCPMCAGAMVQARLGQLVYGIADLKSGAVESTYNIVQSKFYNHQVEVLAGIKEDDCLNLLREKFCDLRKSGK